MRGSGTRSGAGCALPPRTIQAAIRQGKRGLTARSQLASELAAAAAFWVAGPMHARFQKLQNKNRKMHATRVERGP